MKIIGIDEKGNYIAVVTHMEVEKVFDKYYGKTEKLNIGQVIDLGGGYRFRTDIKSACEKMESAMKAFSECKKTMTDFAVMVGRLPDQIEEA